MVPPVRVTDVLPMRASTVPPQVVLAAPWTVRPAGNVSLSGADMVSMTGLLLLRVRTRVETPPTEIVSGLNDFPSVGGTRTGATTGVTVNVATAGDALLPMLVFNAPAGSELM
jgi:hypothetical protein